MNVFDDNREQRRTLHTILLIARDKRRDGIGVRVVNDAIVSELESATPEVCAFVAARFAFWSERTVTGNARFLSHASKGNHAAYEVQGELYRAALAAREEGVSLPDVLARRLA